MLALLWAILPVVNAFVFARAPIGTLIDEGEQGLTIKQLFSKKIFWVLMLMMLCAGASEQAVSQWASTFAESGLGMSKTLGDLAGPMAFAVLMGLSRVYYGKRGDRINLDRFMSFSAILCIVSYLCISLVPMPALALAGCALCGLSVGILWPGTFSKAAASIRAVSYTHLDVYKRQEKRRSGTAVAGQGRCKTAAGRLRCRTGTAHPL